MEPHVTIIWFVLPQWFQEMGAFLKEENIALAVDWAETAFKLFGELSALTCNGHEVVCQGQLHLLRFVARAHGHGRLDTLCASLLLEATAQVMILAMVGSKPCKSLGNLGYF